MFSPYEICKNQILFNRIKTTTKTIGRCHHKLGPNFASLSKKWLLKENWFGIQIEKSIIFKGMISVNTFGKINQPPLKYLPCVVLSKPSVGKTCFIESGSTLKAPNLSCLAASDRKVKTLLTITLWLNLIVKSRITLPHLDKGEGRKSTFTHLIYIYLSDCLFLKKLKWKKVHYDLTRELFLM